MSVRSGRKRLLFGVLAATILVAITSVPSTVGAAPTKLYSLSVTPTTAIAGISTDFDVTMTNKTPGNSNPNSFYVTVPFLVTGNVTASIVPPPAPPGSTNQNASATVEVVGSRVNVRTLDPVKSNQVVVLKITATPTLGSCGATAYSWAPNGVKVYTGGSLSGSTFNLTGASPTTTVSCPVPNLSVTKTAVTTPISVGDDAEFNITVTNATGAGTASNVSVLDTLPAGLTWSEASDPSNFCSITSGSSLSCSITTLAGGASYTVQVKATTSAAGTVENSEVSLNGTTVATPDAKVEVLGAGLSVTKVADNEGAVVAGQPIGYTITVHNSVGSGAAKNVNLSDTLPTNSGLTWLIESETADSCTDPIVGGVLSCNIGTLAGGSSYTVHITSSTTPDMVSQVGQTISNTATVTATNVTPDPDDSDSDSITLYAGILDCGQTATQGGGSNPLNELVRLDNVGGGCGALIPFTLDSGPGVAPGCDDVSPQCILLTKDLLDQDAQFFWTVTWAPETGDYMETETEFDFDLDGTFEPLELCLADANDDGLPELPGSDPWCLVDTSTELQIDTGLVIVTETYFGSGDPGGKR